MNQAFFSLPLPFLKYISSYILLINYTACISPMEDRNSSVSHSLVKMISIVWLFHLFLRCYWYMFFPLPKTLSSVFHLANSYSSFHFSAFIVFPSRSLIPQPHINWFSPLEYHLGICTSPQSTLSNYAFNLVMMYLMFVSPPHLSEFRGKEPCLFYSPVSSEPSPAQYSISAH